MPNFYQFLLLFITTCYHFFANWREKKTQKPLGKLIDIGGYKLHFYSKGEGEITVLIDHSLGGIDGYFLVEEITKIARVCIYDRAGYGWSENSPKPRCSEEIVRELRELLIKTKIEPPYILVGNSFGSYNVRLYAHYFPQEVIGIVLTDGLNEKAMLKMPFLLKALKLLFFSGFIISSIAALLGVVRVLGAIGVFELIKKELRNYSQQTLQPIKRSFYSSKHWLTMAREIWNLEKSGAQVNKAENLGNLPVINIKANTFLYRNFLNFYMPLKAADRLRDRMHESFLKISTNITVLNTNKSSHFVWVDEPQIIINAINLLLNNHSKN